MSSLRVPGKPSGGQGLPHGGVVLESVSAASGGPLLGGCIFSPAPAPPLVTACLVHPATDPQVVLRDPQVVPQPRFASVFPAPLALPSPSAPSQMRPTPTAPPPVGTLSLAPKASCIVGVKDPGGQELCVSSAFWAGAGQGLGDRSRVAPRWSPLRHSTDEICIQESSFSASVGPSTVDSPLLPGLFLLWFCHSLHRPTFLTSDLLTTPDP